MKERGVEMKFLVRGASAINGVAKVTWVAAAFLGGRATEKSLSRDAFVAAYGCPKDQVAVSGNDDSLPIEVVGR
jgi:hypothetical protein